MLTKFVINRLETKDHQRQVFAGWGFKNAVWTAPNDAFATVVLFEQEALALTQVDIMREEAPAENYAVTAIAMGAL